MSDDDSDCDEGGLFGSIGFMFDTARQKISKDFTLTIDTPLSLLEQFEESTGGVDDKTMEVTVSLYIIDDDPGHVQSGQYLWPAALSLSSHLMQNWSNIISSTPSFNMSSTPPVIVELGSGVGMCGQFLGKFFVDLAKRLSSFSLPTVILTDYDPGCLEMLTDNIKLNSLDSHCYSSRVEWGKELDSVYDLSRQTCGTSEVIRPFLVIGSDLLYCVSVVRPLFSSVRAMLLKSCDSKNSGSDNSGLFILASSFDIGEDVQLEMDTCCAELGINQVEVQSLDLASDPRRYRVQYFNL